MSIPAVAGHRIWTSIATDRQTLTATQDTDGATTLAIGYTDPAQRLTSVTLSPGETRELAGRVAELRATMTAGQPYGTHLIVTSTGARAWVQAKRGIMPGRWAAPVLVVELTGSDKRLDNVWLDGERADELAALLASTLPTVEIVTVAVGSPEFHALFGDLLTDRDFADRMWRDSETSVADLLGVNVEEPRGPKLLTVAVVDGQPAAWAGHQLVVEDGETVVKATDSYDRPPYWHLELYPAVYAARQVLIGALCAELGVDAVTYVYIDPLWLHLGWTLMASDVSKVEGLDEHRWYLLRWSAGR